MNYGILILDLVIKVFTMSLFGLNKQRCWQKMKKEGFKITSAIIHKEFCLYICHDGLSAL